MNTSRRCLFVVLLALVSRPVFAAPGAATLVTPSGDVVGTTIAFSWQSVPDSSWYLFWLGKGTPTAFIMQQWYTAEQAGCANGGTCTITLTPPINAGIHVWFIQTWSAGATGPWSTGMTFASKDPTPTWSSKLPAGRRFTLVLDNQAVLDNETGLVWERTPLPNVLPWKQQVCSTHAIAERLGFREPTIAEMATLIDLGQATHLPAGHPFQLGNIAPRFWSQTSYASDTAYAWGIDLNEADGLHLEEKTLSLRFWCVRAATGATQ